jgi:transforming growth factor-beta-induced protein
MAMSLFCTLLLFSYLAVPTLQQSLSRVLSSHANLSSFNDILTNSYPGLLSNLEEATQAQPITILAPSNLAFSNIPYYPVIGPAWASSDANAIGDILKYHVIPLDITSGSLMPTFQYFPTWLTDIRFTNVTSGQRVGAVMQQGATKEMIFVSGQSTRSLVTTADVPFNGGCV